MRRKSVSRKLIAAVRPGMKTFKLVVLGMVLLVSLAAGRTNVLQRVGFRHGLQQSPWSEVRSGRQSLCCGGRRGGTLSTAGVCTQVVAPIGPYTGGFTARISKVTPDGTVYHRRR